jgi:hypothetical protein
LKWLRNWVLRAKEPLLYFYSQHCDRLVVRIWAHRQHVVCLGKKRVVCELKKKIEADNTLSIPLKKLN